MSSSRSSKSLSGRLSLSSAPLRIRNENSDNGKGKGAGPSTRKKSSLGHSSSAKESFGCAVGLGMKSKLSSRSCSTSAPGRSSGIGVRGRTNVLKDPRPLADKRYQHHQIRKLLEYLVSNNYPHAVSQKLLESPSSKDFFKIFEFVYGRLNPGYKMAPKMEEEIPKVLKLLGYPFSLSKSYLFSVGSPHAWPHLCAAIIWIIDLVKFADRIQSSDGGIDSFIFPASSDNFDEVPEEKIVFDYCEKTYHAFMNGKDSFEEEDAMLHELLQLQCQGGGNIDVINEDNAKLQRDLATMEETIEQHEDRLRKQDEHNRVEEEDVQKITAYCVELEQYQRHRNISLKAIEEECTRLETDLKIENQRHESMMQIYQNQDLMPGDVERMKEERKELKHQLENLRQQVEQVDDERGKISIELAKIFDKLSSKVSEYNHVATDLKLIPETAENAHGEDYSLQTGFTSNIGNKIEQTIKPVLMQMKKQATAELRIKEKEKYQMTYNLDQMQEAVDDMKERLSQKETQLTNLESEIDSLKQLSQRDEKASFVEKEQIQQKLSELEIGLKEAEAERTQIELEYQKMCELHLVKRKEIERKNQDLDEKAETMTAAFDSHEEDIKNHLRAFVNSLKELYEVSQERVEKTKEQASQRRAWLAAKEQELNKLKDEMKLIV